MPLAAVLSGMALWIGTSGWQYRHWDRSFYPAEVPKDEQLRYYRCALRDAGSFARAAGDLGLETTRVVAPEEVDVG